MPGQQAGFAFDANAEAQALTSWNPREWPVGASWQPLVDKFLASPAASDLGNFISRRLLEGARIYPPRPFHALELTPLDEVRVVIVGQDPYHGPGQAHGLAFSVPEGVRPPPSLRNIFKEVARSVPPAPNSPSSASLVGWARQGVLLINTCLTVEDGKPGSHAGHGWEALTDQIVSAVAQHASAAVFMLWGAHAQARRKLISGGHLILAANHPSPLSALRSPQPFMGCNHFQTANTWLLEHGQKAIRW